MYSKILVPTDGSACACAAAGFASELLAGGVAQSVTLLVVVSIAKAVKNHPRLNPTQVDEDLVRSKLKHEARQVLEQTRAVFVQKGLQVEDRLEMCDDPGERIVEIARQQGYDLIVMGNRGRSLVKELIIGSVSNFVLLNAPCPVVIYKK